MQLLLWIAATLLLVCITGSEPDPLDVEAALWQPIQYAVVAVHKTACMLGQSKAGTTTLWYNMLEHPLIKAIDGKEPGWWQVEAGVALCDNSVEGYLNLTAVQRRKHGTSVLVGDWSTTYFSCNCCPAVLKQLNPKLKLVVLLRDPVRRTISRFIEQMSSPLYPFHSMVANYTLAAYARKAVDDLNGCVDWARRVSGIAAAQHQSATQGDQQQAAQAQQEFPLSKLMRMQCYQRSNIVGWSAYDIWLDNYLQHFPPEQLLVLYMEGIAHDPLGTFKKMEEFLGVPPHTYELERAHSVANSHDCIGWTCIRNKTHTQPLSLPTLHEAVDILRDAYRPHMQRVISMADAGQIAPVPKSWREKYGGASTTQLPDSAS